MNLSEPTRLELMRITLRFTADNFKIAQNGLETAHGVSECYRVLFEALSHDEHSNSSKKSSPFLLFLPRISKRSFFFLSPADKQICTIKEMLSLLRRVLPSQVIGQGNDSLHSVVNRHTHTSSPIDSQKQPAPDSTSEAGKEGVAQPAFELSFDELLQVAQGIPATALRERALNEIKRRCGESVEEPS